MADWDEYPEPLWNPLESEVELLVKEYFEEAEMTNGGIAATDNGGSSFDAPRQAMEVNPTKLTLTELLDRSEMLDPNAESDHTHRG